MAKGSAFNEELVEMLYEQLEPLAKANGLEVLEIEATKDTLRVTFDDPKGNVDASKLELLTPLVSELLDSIEAVDKAYSGQYMLEVSSPGLERTLRTPVHFARFIGSKVNIKLKSVVSSDRRVLGWIQGVQDSTVIIGFDSPVGSANVQVIELIDIERAKTVFEWQIGEKRTMAPKSGSKDKK